MSLPRLEVRERFSDPGCHARDHVTGSNPIVSERDCPQRHQDCSQAGTGCSHGRTALGAGAPNPQVRADGGSNRARGKQGGKADRVGEGGQAHTAANEDDPESYEAAEAGQRDVPDGA